MIKIKEHNPIFVGTMFDYELEDGALLYSGDWNGEAYFAKDADNDHEYSYRPIYREVDGDPDDLEVIGFEKSY